MGWGGVGNTGSVSGIEFFFLSGKLEVEFMVNDYLYVLKMMQGTRTLKYIESIILSHKVNE